jgi:CRISPR-associated protein Cmr4
MMNCINLYLLAPLHTGGNSQEGNLVGIARESHTNFPYIPSSSIRGRLRASQSDRVKKTQLFGNLLEDQKDTDFVAEYKAETDIKLDGLQQGQIWIGDASILWLPVPSMSHGVVWITCPMLLRRWGKLHGITEIPPEYSTSLGKTAPIYLKDAIIDKVHLHEWSDWRQFVTQQHSQIDRVLVLPDRHCGTVIQMSLWRQVKISLDEHKHVQKGGGFRSEESIPPDTMMYFPWGTTAQTNNKSEQARSDFQELLAQQPILQFGGQESLGRGFVEHWSSQREFAAEDPATTTPVKASVRRAAT